MELKRTIDGAIHVLPSECDSSLSRIKMLETNEQFGRPDNYATRLPGRLRALTTDKLGRVVRSAFDPDKIAWIMVSDKAKVMNQLTALGLPVHVAGNPKVP